MVVAMSSKIKLWQIDKGNKPIEVDTEGFDVSNLEKRLESWIETNPTILGEKLLIIDRQHSLPNKETIDLLAVDTEGKVVIIELKRKKTSREVVAQVLDYEAFFSDIKEDELNEIATTYFEEKKLKWENLREAFQQTFGETEVSFNESIRTFIVAPELDETTEKIINYLSSKYKMDINGVTFKYYKDETGRELIIRNVVVSPEERRKRTIYSLDYHLERAKDKKSKSLLESIFGYFSKDNYRLHSTKYYVKIFLDDLEVGWIRPRKTIAHITLYCDFYKLEDVSRLSKQSESDPHFEVTIDKEWITRDNAKIISIIRLRELDLKTFKKYQKEIERAVESLVFYEEHYEGLEKERKEISK